MDPPVSSSLLVPVVLLGIALVAAACSTDEPLDAPSPLPTADTATADPDAPPTATTTALDGNRVLTGRLHEGPLRQLDAGLVPELLVAAPLVDGHLLVASDRDRVVAWVVRDDGVTAAPPDVVQGLGRPPTSGRPALVRDGAAWRFAATTGPGDPDWSTSEGPLRRDGDRVTFGAAVVEDLLPDARWAIDGDRLAVPVRPTREYGHAVLGDDVEAAGLALADAGTGEVEVISFAPGVVLEGTGIVLADVDGDGRSEPVFTLTDAEIGARQAILLDGRIVEGPAIGQGNRWRHLLGVHDGRILEIVTPHLARTFQVLELDDDAVTVTTSTPGTLASHAIGSRDLDEALLVDATGDGHADAIGPADGADDLLRIVASTDGAVVRQVGLPGRRVGNLTGFSLGDRAVVAAGSTDGTVLLLGLERQ